MEAAALGVAFLLVWTFVGYHLLQLNLRATREDLASIVKNETERLERKVDAFVHASSRANVLAEHAVARVERAEEAASKPSVVLVVPPVDGETKH